MSLGGSLIAVLLFVAVVSFVWVLAVKLLKAPDWVGWIVPGAFLVVPLGIQLYIVFAVWNARRRVASRMRGVACPRCKAPFGGGVKLTEIPRGVRATCGACRAETEYDAGTLAPKGVGGLE